MAGAEQHDRVTEKAEVPPWSYNLASMIADWS